MKKLLIPFVAAFGLSLGGSAGFVMVRAPKAGAHASAAHPELKPDSAKADSTKKEAVAQVAADSSHIVAPATVTDSMQKSTSAAQAKPATSPAAAPVASAPAVKQPDKPVEKVSAVADAAKLGKVAAAIQSVPASDTAVSHKLAQIFSAMPAKDAARVLEQMDDADVRTIIASLSNKQQAAVLGNFPTQRAAGIIRATLRASGGAK